MPIEPIQLDDRSFEQIFAEARARIPVHTPEWTNFNDSDPGITIVQLFAFMTENLLYRSNRIPEANRRKFLSLLGIPLQPASPGRGIVIFHNDRGPLQPFLLDCGQEVRAGKVPFRTRTPVNILPITAVAYYKKPQDDLDQTTKSQYQQLFSTFFNSSTDELQLYKATLVETPQPGKPLPVVDLSYGGDTIDSSLWVALAAPPNVDKDQVRAAIATQTLSLGIYPALDSSGVVLPPATSEDSNPVVDPGLVFEIAAPDPDPQNRNVGIGPAKYTRLTVDYAENVLNYPGIVHVDLPDYGKLLLWDFDPEEEGTGDYPPLVEDKDLAKRIVTWIRISLPKPLTDSASSPFQSRGQVPPILPVVKPTTAPQAHTKLSWVGANAARVIQAARVEKEPLGVATGAPDQVYKVANTPVLVQEMQEFAPGISSPTTVVVEVQDANGNWEIWQLTDDLYSAKSTDQVYALDPEAGTISFGSGLRGMRPPFGSGIRVSYEYGGGLQGQVPIGAINKSAAIPGAFKVENPMPTWGAGPAEDVIEGERNISRYLRHRDRLVTASDFRDITMRTPGVDVGRVEVLPLFNPAKFDPSNPIQTWPGTITVMVIPTSDAEQPDAPMPDRQFLDTVSTWLDPRRLVTTEVYVCGPDYVPIWVSVGIVTMAGQFREVVQKNVMNAIRDYLSPLIGGPPTTSDITLEATCVSSSTQSGSGSMQSGMGWPLSTDVRVQDLEAVANRVNGVRYVDSVKMGIVPPGGVTVTSVDRVPFVGLQLPRLIGIGVREGPAEDLPELLGQQPSSTSAPPNTVPVPLLPKKC